MLSDPQLIQPQQPSANLFQFFNNELLSDTIVLNKTSSKEYVAHKIILAAGSRFFYHMLVPPQADSLQQKDGKVVLELPEKIDSKFKLDDDSVIPILLKFLYSNQNPEAIKSEFKNENVFQLLSLSHSLGVNTLSNCIADYISKNILTEENCGRIYYESIVYDNEALMKDCGAMLKKTFNKVMKNLNEFEIVLDLPFETFHKLIIDDELSVGNEKEVCDLVLNYIKIRKNANVENKKEVPGEGEVIPEGDAKPEAAAKPEEEAKPEEKKEEANPNPPSQENFVETMKKQLEKVKNQMVKKPLSVTEERSLIEAIRFSFLSHSDLLSVSLDPLMQNHKDLVLEGLSVRLNTYEKNLKSDPLKINLKTRTYLDQNEQKLKETEKERSVKAGNDENALKNPNFNPVGSYDDFGKYGKSGGDPKKSIAGVMQQDLHRLEDSFNNDLRHGQQQVNRSAFNYNTRMGAQGPSGSNFFDNNFGNNLGFSTGGLNTYQPNKLSNSIVHPPQMYERGGNLQMQKSTPNPNIRPTQFQQDKPVEFIYEYDFDENGVFYYLGTLGKTILYKNPHDIGQIKVFASSIGRGRLADFVGREIVNLRTLNEPFSFFGVDLGEDRTLVPYSYSICNRNSSSHVLMGWQLEASTDKTNFNIIDTRVFMSQDPKIHQDLEKERALLKTPGCTSTWGIDPQVGYNFPNGFRFFILKQIIKNSSGAYNLALSGFELYGKGKGSRWQFQ